MGFSGWIWIYGRAWHGFRRTSFDCEIMEDNMVLFKKDGSFHKKLICIGMAGIISAAAFSLPADYFEGEDSLFADSYGYSDDVDWYEEDEQSSADDLRVQDLLDALYEKTDSILGSRSYSDSVADRIAEIESMKQEIVSLLEVDSDGEKVRQINERMGDEISERMRRTPRAAEVNPDGSLNARGQERLENDIEMIRKKYEGLLNAGAPDAESVRKAESLRRNVADKIRSLESKEFTENSSQKSGISLKVGKFIGRSGYSSGTRDNAGSEGWPYEISYEIDGKKIVSYTGLLTYSDISGKKIPSVPSIRSTNYEADLEAYENFLDSVEVFNAAFEDGVGFIEAEVSGSVKAGRDPSSYVFTINAISLKNVVTGKTVRSFRYNKSAVTYQAYPEIDVDISGLLNRTDSSEKAFDGSSASDKKRQLRKSEPKNWLENDGLPTKKQDEGNVRTNGSRRYEDLYVPNGSADKKNGSESADGSKSIDSGKTREKKLPKYEDAKNVPASTDLNFSARKSKLQTGRTSYGAILYALPGTLNAYMSGENVTATLGYSLSFGITDHFFMGLNAELGPDLFCYYDGSDILIPEDFGGLVFTGVAGWCWSFGPSFRLSLYGEGGLMFNKGAGGLGVSMEIASPNSNVAFLTSLSTYCTSDLENILKATVGMEVLF